MKILSKSSLSRRSWHKNKSKKLDPSLRPLKQSYLDQSDSGRVTGECWGPVGPRPSLRDYWSCLTYFWDFDRLSKVERKSKQRSRDLSPFLGIFGFWAYVTGMGMLAHGFTHA
jgi:hypothetical protein